MDGLQSRNPRIIDVFCTVPRSREKVERVGTEYELSTPYVIPKVAYFSPESLPHAELTDRARRTSTTSKCCTSNPSKPSWSMKDCVGRLNQAFTNTPLCVASGPSLPLIPCHISFSVACVRKEPQDE